MRNNLYLFFHKWPLIQGYKLKTIILMVYVFFSIGVLTLFGILIYNFEAVLQKNLSVNHTQEVILHTEKVMSFLKDTETGQRGYIITKDSSFLEPYSVNLDSVKIYLKKIKTLTKDNLQQQINVDSLLLLSNHRLSFLQQAIHIYQAKGHISPELIEVLVIGKKTMNDFRKKINLIVSIERQILRERTLQLERNINFSYTVIVLLAFGLVTSVFLSLMIINRQLSKQNELNNKLDNTNLKLKISNEELATQNEELNALNEELTTANETIRVQANALFLLNEERYQTLIDSIQDIFFALDTHWQYLYVNATAEKFLGKKMPELVGKHYLDVLPYLKDSDYPTFFNQTVQSQQPQSKLAEYKDDFGKTIYFEITAYPSKFGLAVFARNITDNYLKEIQLQASEQKYRFLFDNNPNPMWLYDIDSLAFLDVNQTAISRYGYSKEEFLTMKVPDIYPPEDRERLEANLQETKLGYYESYSWKHKLKNEEVIDVEIFRYSFEDKGKHLRIVTANNITERLKIANELEKSLQNISAIINSTDDLIWAIDRDLRLISFNQAFEQVINYALNQKLQIGDRFPEELLSSTNQTFWQNHIQSVFAGEKVMFEYIEKGEPDLIFLEIFLNPIQSKTGEITGVAGFGRNVSASKRVEQKQKLQEQNTYALINNTQEIIWSIDKNYRLLSFNKSYERFIQSQTDLSLKMGENVLDLNLNPELKAYFIQLYEKAFTGYRFVEEISFLQHNEVIFIESAFNPIFNENSEVVGVGCFVRNISARKEMELEREELIKNLSSFAAYTSHNLRRPVANILGLISIFNFEDLQDEYNSEVIKMLKISTGELDKIIHQMNKILEETNLINETDYYKSLENDKK